MERLSLPSPSLPLNATLPLVASKSESNRALILRALAGDGIEIDNVSAARDTRLMENLLHSEDHELNAQDAGTTFRFLTAYCAVTGRMTHLTGTPRMKQRPIGILVDALRTLGAHISYAENEGFPPLNVTGFQQRTDEVSVRGDVSSQYISALLLVAPFLPKGLRIRLEGEVASRPYIDMTIAWMARFGLEVHETSNHFTIAPQSPTPGRYTVESDWSAAGYWYTTLALAKSGTLILRHLRTDSLQGDRAVVKLFEQLGVQSRFQDGDLHLSCGERASSFEADFTHIPDQAQTFAVCCAGLGLPARLTGLKSLRIKETDRIAALQAELAKFNCEVEVIGDEEIRLPGTPFRVEGQTVATYEDHRMAMAFAPLAVLGPIQIEEPSVVQKSYPSFWEDWQLVSGDT